MKWIFLAAVLARCRHRLSRSINVVMQRVGRSTSQSLALKPRNACDDHYKRQAAEASIQRDRRALQRRNAEQQPVAVGI